jgi:hypothetical protein
MTWSILIPTMTERAQQFDFISHKLKQQIKACMLEDKIEILTFLDSRGEHTTGHKRNWLIEQSRGEYISFVDDDDDVSDNFIPLIYERLQKKPDCVSLVGIMSVNGKYPRLFIHSIKYTTCFEYNKVYYRPPNHLNPMKRSIAIQFKFADVTLQEDTPWALRIADSRLLKTEEYVFQPYYFYQAGEAYLPFVL